jgi:hypothetical protein
MYFHAFLLLYLCSQHCFRHLGKISKSDISFVMSVRLSVPTAQLGSRWADFHEIFCYSLSRKFKSDKNNRHYMRGPAVYSSYVIARLEFERSPIISSTYEHWLCWLSNVRYSRNCSWIAQGEESPLILVMTVGGQHIDPDKNMILYHCRTFSPVVSIYWVFRL